MQKRIYRMPVVLVFLLSNENDIRLQNQDLGIKMREILPVCKDNVYNELNTDILFHISGFVCKDISQINL